MDRRRPRAARQTQSAEQIACELSGVLICGLRRALRNEPITRSAKNRLAPMGLIEKKPDAFSGLTPLGLQVLRAAIAIEARQRTDPEEGLDPKGESAGRRHRPSASGTPLVGKEEET